MSTLRHLITVKYKKIPRVLYTALESIRLENALRMHAIQESDRYSDFYPIALKFSTILGE
jgi:hypothetical protein